MTTPTGKPLPGTTSLTLLERLGAREEEAWSRLVYLYGPLVRYWASRRSVQGADADDLVQEVFREVAGSLANYRRGGSFRGWLFGITRNVLRRQAERAARQPRAGGGTEAQILFQELPDHSGPVDDEGDPPEEQSAVHRRALELVRSEFEARTWQMFLQVAVDGRSPVDVAADLDVSPAAVRQAKSRVLRRLREELGEVLD